MDFIDGKECGECGGRLMKRTYPDKDDTVICAKCGHQPAG